MKANILHGVGQALELTNVPDLVPGPEELVVRLTAAALNHRDVWIRKGQYAGLKFPIVLGSDGVGTVTAAGDQVAPSWIGKPVIINPSLGWGDREVAQNKSSFNILGLPHDGTFAQEVKVPAENVHDLPTYLSEQEAAAIPLAGLTAFRAVHHRGEISSEDNVLITGVGGGAASIAVQIAAAAGASVFVTSGSDHKIEAARELGAAGGANYNLEGWEDRLRELAESFDLIIDSGGGDGFLSLIDLANFGGRIVFFGATRGNPNGFDSRKVFWKQLSILGTTMGSPSDFGSMLQYFEHHRIKPKVDEVFPFNRANDAVDKMENGSQMGKIVLDIE